MPTRRAVKANTKTKLRRQQPPRHQQPSTIAPVVLRGPAACVFVGLKPTQFSKHVKAGHLPQPVKLTDSGRAVGWLKTELEAWLLARVAKRDAVARR